MDIALLNALKTIKKYCANTECSSCDFDKVVDCANNNEIDAPVHWELSDFGD